jgi:acetyltransferase-like isoleucine patch superfamily enzyme
MNEKKRFENLFLKLINNKKNRYHPLVWINGNPIIGKNTYIGGFSEINAKGSKVKIGANCDIASFVSINVADSHKKTIKRSNKISLNEIKIGKNVFVGSHSVILGGSVIGDFSVIAAGSVVRGEKIPKYSLAIGNPIKIKESYYKKK